MLRTPVCPPHGQLSHQHKHCTPATGAGTGTKAMTFGLEPSGDAPHTPAAHGSLWKRPDPPAPPVTAARAGTQQQRPEPRAGAAPRPPEAGTGAVPHPLPRSGPGGRPLARFCRAGDAAGPAAGRGRQGRAPTGGRPRRRGAASLPSGAPGDAAGRRKPSWILADRDARQRRGGHGRHSRRVAVQRPPCKRRRRCRYRCAG